MEETPALFVPDFSKHMTTVADIREYNDILWRAELTQYINAAAQYIDQLLKTPAKDIDWDHYEIIDSYAYIYNNIYNDGCYPPYGNNIETKAHISIEPVYDRENFKPVIQCQIIKPANSKYKNINNLHQNVAKARYIIEKLGHIFGERATIKENDDAFLCYIRFPG